MMPLFTLLCSRRNLAFLATIKNRSLPPAVSGSPVSGTDVAPEFLYENMKIIA
jgi:hypothetical protein